MKSNEAAPMVANERHPESVRRRRVQRLLKRDGSRCVWCGCETETSDQLRRRPAPQQQARALLTVEHLVPRRLGGPRYALNNMVIACERCNHARRDDDLDVFYKHLSRSGAEIQRELLLAGLRRMVDSESPRERAKEYAAQQLRALAALAESGSLSPSSCRQQATVVKAPSHRRRRRRPPRSVRQIRQIAAMNKRIRQRVLASQRAHQQQLLSAADRVAAACR